MSDIVLISWDSSCLEVRRRSEELCLTVLRPTIWTVNNSLGDRFALILSPSASSPQYVDEEAGRVKFSLQPGRYTLRYESGSMESVRMTPQALLRSSRPLRDSLARLWHSFVAILKIALS